LRKAPEAQIGGFLLAPATLERLVCRGWLGEHRRIPAGVEPRHRDVADQGNAGKKRSDFNRTLRYPEQRY
jgi:hypothetical protein